MCCYAGFRRTYPTHCWDLLGNFRFFCSQISGKFRKSLDVSEHFRKSFGNVRNKSRKFLNFTGNFRKCLEKLRKNPEISGNVRTNPELSGNVQKLLVISWKFPRHVLENSGKLPGIVQDISRKCPGETTCFSIHCCHRLPYTNQ